MSPDNQEALAGEGVGRAMAKCTGLESGPNGRGEMRVVAHFPAGEEGALFSLLNAALARTPSLPQADEADVERVLSEARAQNPYAPFTDGAGPWNEGFCAAWETIRATMTTRPAGVEEVAWKEGWLPVEEIIATLECEGEHASEPLSQACLQAADMLKGAALTKPAALPKEGEELDAIAHAAAEQWVRSGTWPASERPGKMSMVIAGFLEGYKVALSSLPVSGEVEFPYQRTFNAIGDAVTIEGGNIAISVRRFQESYNRAAPQQATEERA